MTEQEVSARKEMRRIQFHHGHKVSPVISIHIGESWRRALEMDPEGSQLKYVIEELKELLCIRE